MTEHADAPRAPEDVIRRARTRCERLTELADLAVVLLYETTCPRCGNSVWIDGYGDIETHRDARSLTGSTCFMSGRPAVRVPEEAPTPCCPEADGDFCPIHGPASVPEEANDE